MRGITGVALSYCKKTRKPKKCSKKIEKIHETKTQEKNKLPSKKLENPYGKDGYAGETLYEN